MRAKPIYVLEEYDHHDGDTTIIGVADSSERAEEMMHEYYKSEYQVIDIEDIRDSGIEWAVRVKWWWDVGEHYVECSVLCYYFPLNEL